MSNELDPDEESDTESTQKGAFDLGKDIQSIDTLLCKGGIPPVSTDIFRVYWNKIRDNTTIKNSTKKDILDAFLKTLDVIMNDNAKGTKLEMRIFVLKFITFFTKLELGVASSIIQCFEKRKDGLMFVFLIADTLLLTNTTMHSSPDMKHTLAHLSANPISLANLVRGLIPDKVKRNRRNNPNTRLFSHSRLVGPFIRTLVRFSRNRNSLVRVDADRSMASESEQDSDTPESTHVDAPTESSVHDEEKKEQDEDNEPEDEENSEYIQKVESGSDFSSDEDSATTRKEAYTATRNNPNEPECVIMNEIIRTDDTWIRNTPIPGQICVAATGIQPRFIYPIVSKQALPNPAPIQSPVYVSTPAPSPTNPNHTPIVDHPMTDVSPVSHTSRPSTGPPQTDLPVHIKQAFEGFGIHSPYDPLVLFWRLNLNNASVFQGLTDLLTIKNSTTPTEMETQKPFLATLCGSAVIVDCILKYNSNPTASAVMCLIVSSILNEFRSTANVVRAMTDSVQAVLTQKQQQHKCVDVNRFNIDLEAAFRACTPEPHFIDFRESSFITRHLKDRLLPTCRDTLDPLATPHTLHDIKDSVSPTLNNLKTFLLGDQRIPDIPETVHVWAPPCHPVYSMPPRLGSSSIGRTTESDNLVCLMYSLLALPLLRYHILSFLTLEAMVCPLVAALYNKRVKPVNESSAGFITFKSIEDFMITVVNRQASPNQQEFAIVVLFVLACEQYCNPAHPKTGTSARALLNDASVTQPCVLVTRIEAVFDFVLAIMSPTPMDHVASVSMIGSPRVDKARQIVIRGVTPNDASGAVVVELCDVISNAMLYRDQMSIPVTFDDFLVVEFASGYNTGKIIDTDRFRIGPSLSGEYAYYRLCARTWSASQTSLPSRIHYIGASHILSTASSTPSRDTREPGESGSASWVLYDPAQPEKVYTTRTQVQALKFGLTFDKNTMNELYAISPDEISTRVKPFIDFVSTRLLFQRTRAPRDDDDAVFV